LLRLADECIPESNGEEGGYGFGKDVEIGNKGYLATRLALLQEEDMAHFGVYAWGLMLGVDALDLMLWR
jgi:hypothetical protein